MPSKAPPKTTAKTFPPMAIAFMRYSGAAAAEKERPEIIRTDRAAGLATYEERRQPNTPDYSEPHDPAQPIGPDLQCALGYRLSVPHPNKHVLHNVETYQRDGEQD